MATIMKRGEKWQALIRRAGSPQRSRTFERRLDAERWARAVEADMDFGRYVQPTKTTLREAMTRFREEVSVKRGNSEVRRVDFFLRTAKFVDKSLSEVSPTDVQRWKEARLKLVSPATVNREMNLLSGFFTYCKKEWLIPLQGHVVREVKRPPKGKARNRRVSQAEVDAVREACLLHPRGTLRWYVGWMFEFAVETALRRGELTKLRWDSVHMDERWLTTITGKHHGKHDDTRIVPLSDRALEILQALPHDDERVFPVWADSTGPWWMSLMELLDIKDMHFHDSRHEAVSRLAKVYNVMELARIIGHRDLKSLMTYYNPTGAELAKKLRDSAPLAVA